MKLTRVIIFLLISLSILYSSSYENLTQQFNQAKIDYLKAVVNGNTDSEISNLNTIINVGKQIKVDTTRYENALKSIYANQNKKTTKTSSISAPKQPNITNPKPPQEVKQLIDPKFSITSVTASDNDIIIRFNQDITLEDLSFTQEKGTIHKDIFDINGNFKDAQSTILKIDGIDRVIVTQNTPKTFRVIIQNSSDPNSIYMVNQRSIVLRTFPTQKEEPTKQTETLIQQTEFLRSRTVVIDPGHGGKDPGAVIGKNHEKTAVLGVGLHLKDLLTKRGYKVILTRDKDKFLELKQRTDVANRHNADIFVSIHANAVEKQNAANAKGVETYFLSPARSERAKRVAALENKEEMQELTNSSQNALLTILNRGRITASNKLAIDIQRYMLHEVRKLHKDTSDGGVREGPFYVLLGAQMPSILVEIGYMSHAQEGARIFDKNYQKHVAKGIANGIDSYFLNNP